MAALICPAPAKLNLFLHVVGRREDGYHLLQTVFQFVDLCDTLYFDLTDSGEIQCDGLDLEPEGNLIWRAAQLLREHTGIRQGIHIRVDKHIPLGGGLGGGSSDAAATLLALNRLWELNLASETLTRLGLQLGADVPVFLNGQAAWAEGVGEHLIPLPDLPEPWYLLIHPGCSISTREIFDAPDLPRNMPPVELEDFLAQRTVNVCEALVIQRYLPVHHALAWLGSHAVARLTGTGACVFAAFPEADVACQVLEQMPEDWDAWIVKGMNRSPLCAALMKGSEVCLKVL